MKLLVTSNNNNIFLKLNIIWFQDLQNLYTRHLDIEKPMI